MYGKIFWKIHAQFSNFIKINRYWTGPLRAICHEHNAYDMYLNILYVNWHTSHQDLANRAKSGLEYANFLPLDEAILKSAALNWESWTPDRRIDEQIIERYARSDVNEAMLKGC